LRAKVSSFVETFGLRSLFVIRIAIDTYCERAEDD
jgi:hypothetical protein